MNTDQNNFAGNQFEASPPLFPDLLDEWSDYRSDGYGRARHKFWSIDLLCTRQLHSGADDLRGLHVEWDAPAASIGRPYARFTVEVSHWINSWVQTGKKRELRQRHRSVSKTFTTRADAVALATRIHRVMKSIRDKKEALQKGNANERPLLIP